MLNFIRLKLLGAKLFMRDTIEIKSLFSGGRNLHIKMHSQQHTDNIHGSCNILNDNSKHILT